MPWKIVERDERHCVAKENEDGTAGDIVPGGCHDTKEQALDHMRALYANEADMEQQPEAETEQHVEAEEVAVTESLIALADYASYRPVQFLRTGTFTDANGNKVTITEDILDKIVANFASGAAEQDVPIDIQHERREAAGWIKSVERVGDRLIAQVEWTEYGRRLVSDKIYKYLSATIDKARWLLKSISLVNFPAVKGLPAIEFGEYIHSDAVPPSQPQQLEGHQTEDVAEQPLEALSMTEEHAPQAVTEEKVETQPEGKPAPSHPVLSDTDVAQLRASIEEEMKTTLMAEYARLEETKASMFAELMAKVREERNVVEFSQSVTSTGRHALPVTADRVKEVLMDLPKAHRVEVMSILKAVHEAGTVDFTEHGTANGKAVKKDLDPEMAGALRQHVLSGGSLDIFFEANAEQLGSPANWNLSEFGGNNG